jgi:CBS domain-containing protein
MEELRISHGYPVVMQIAEFGTRRPVCIDREASVQDASRLMREQRADTLVVVGAGSEVDGAGSGVDGNNAARIPVGTISMRDVVTRVVAVGLDPCIVTAGDLLWSRPTTVHATDSVPEAFERLCQSDTEALPVVDSDGIVTGVVSLEDILQALAGGESSKRHSLHR